MMTFFVDAYQEALAALSVISVWLESLVSPNAILWYAVGLLTLPFLQYFRIRFAFWKMKRRLVRKVGGGPNHLIPSAMWVFAKAYPKAPIEIRKEEIENVINVLSKLVDIGGGSPTTTQERLWSKVDSSWVDHFVSKCRMVQEPLLQEALAKAFLYQAISPGRLGHRDIETLATFNIQDWKTFTAICCCSCGIGGRITPVIFNYEDNVYKRIGLDAGPFHFPNNADITAHPELVEGPPTGGSTSSPRTGFPEISKNEKALIR